MRLMRTADRDWSRVGDDGGPDCYGYDGAGKEEGQQKEGEGHR